MAVTNRTVVTTPWEGWVAVSHSFFAHVVTERFRKEWRRGEDKRCEGSAG